MRALASVAVALWHLPCSSDVQTLREQHDQLAAGVEQLNELGGRADLQHCGDENHLCVRVDLAAGRFIT